ncbi:uncharacterized protein LOC127729459 [Mytilus californianus]|uniref:uncharacterized protein LOC127729459 n=1 Tax=Mytilus californianus TaxID=6549 RepID=UPI0022476271|nr:uncharacterized protein LOC127729459 [Mytilus californianus]XP_052093239.1 uncharacterized protein LOC127729459 [Mytilus californianus]XP_052093240.1 uncharacterized protein LOC127729459 [Mytilus californianus]
MFITEDIGEPGSEDDGRLPFIGRFREREEIKTCFKKRKNRIVQISGAPCIGKQRLIQQICEELDDENEKEKNSNLHIGQISCKYIRSWENFLEHVIDSLPEDGFSESAKLSENQIIRVIKSHTKPNNYVLLTFTKLDNFIFDKEINVALEKFSDMCSKILRCSSNTFLLLSSEIRLNINVGYKVRYVSLLRLPEPEAISLLRKAAPDTDFADTEREIVNGCHCTPGLVLEAASILMHPDYIIKPKYLANLLCDPKNALDLFSSNLVAQNEHLRVKVQKLLERLPSSLQSSVHDLTLLQGSFSKEALQAVLGHKKSYETTLQIIPLRDSSVLEFDKETHLFSMNPLLRACIDESPNFSTSDLVRLRFVKFFVDLMVTVDSKLYKDSHKSVVEYFHHDYANMKQLLQQAIHCTEDIFTVLMKAVSEAEELFIKCFPVEQVKDFYNHLLNAAEQYGKPEEIYILKMFLAQAMTQMKVDTNRREVTQLFQEAFKSMSWDHPGYHHMTLLGFLGRFIIRQGKYQKGLRFIQSAIKMKVDGNTRVHRRLIEFHVQKALAEVFRENFSTAEEALNEALDLAQKEAPYHSAIAIIFNTFGLIMDRSGRDEDRALQWYKSSLEERRKFADISPEILVAPLNNIANQSVKRGNNGYALKLTEEALNIRRKCGWNDYYTGLTLRQKAEIFLVQGKLTSAIQLCDEAYKICVECTPRHFFLNEIIFLRFHCHLPSKDLGAAKDDFKKMMIDRKRYSQNTERGEQTMHILFHALFLYDEDEWDNAYNELQVEVRRLRDLAFKCNDFDKYLHLCSKINDISHLFTSKRVDTNDIHKIKCQELVRQNCKLCPLINVDLLS